MVGTWDFPGILLGVSLDLVFQVGNPIPGGEWPVWKTMGTVERTGANVELEVDLTTGTAAVDGGRIELPPKEFALLAHLAAHPGKAISRAELIEAVWPETPMMTDQDLYWYVNRLRKNIGDDKRETKVIANRRNFGYFLDLPHHHVKITGSASGVTALEVASTPEPEPKTDPIVREERPVPLVAVDEEPPPTETPLPRSRSPRRALLLGRRTMAAIAVILATALLAMAWSATRDRTPAPDSPDDIVGAPEGSAGKGGTSDEAQTNSGARSRTRKDRPGSTSGGQVIAAPAGAAGTATSSGAATPGTPRTERTEATEQLPPPPTRFLYQLVNEETGDHFVTTDPAKSSEREAAGYVGGAVARVYMERQPGTKAISTNYGRAYIFIRAMPETSPRTETVPLWFVSDGAGDFFYVTSKADVPEQGWSAALAGYVGPQ